MKTTRTRLFSLLAAIAMLGAACGGSEFDRQEAVDDMVAEGVPQEDAECFVDRVVEEFGADRLESDDTPTDEENETMINIMFECMDGFGE